MLLFTIFDNLGIWQGGKKCTFNFCLNNKTKQNKKNSTESSLFVSSFFRDNIMTHTHTHTHCIMCVCVQLYMRE